MERRELGSTGPKVTQLGLGLAALGRPGYINIGHAADLTDDYSVEAMQDRAFQVLDAAWSVGVRYFDAARSYGRAEEFLSAWLRARNISSDDVTVGSKWGYTYTADWQIDAEHHEIKEHSLPVLRRQIEESRALLGEFLKLYQIHSATLESGVLDNQDVLDELGRLRDEGLVIGLSLSGPRQADTLRKALPIEIGGRPLFRVVQATWNLLERSAGEALEEAKAAGCGVILKESLANGRLTERNDEPSFRDRLDLLRKLAAAQTTSVDALSLAGAIARPWADVVLSGAATVEHLRSNAEACSVEWNEELEEKLGGLEEPPEEYWATRSRLAWN